MADRDPDVMQLVDGEPLEALRRAAAAAPGPVQGGARQRGGR